MGGGSKNKMISFEVKGKNGITVESPSRDVKIKAVITDEETPMYKISGIGEAKEIKVNGLPFYQDDSNPKEWYNLVKINEVYKGEEDGEVLIPVDLFVGGSFENKSEEELRQMELKSMEKQYKEYSNIPLRKLREE